MLAIPNDTQQIQVKEMEDTASKGALIDLWDSLPWHGFKSRLDKLFKGNLPWIASC